MSDERQFALRQIDQARADFAAIEDDLDFVKAQLARMPARAYFSTTLLVATASIWMLLGALALLLAR
jgi:hypothetical protein